MIDDKRQTISLAVAGNISLTCLNLVLAWMMWQLRAKLAETADRLNRTERYARCICRRTTTTIARRRRDTADLAQCYRQLQHLQQLAGLSVRVARVFAPRRGS